MSYVGKEVGQIGLEGCFGIGFHEVVLHNCKTIHTKHRTRYFYKRYLYLIKLYISLMVKIPKSLAKSLVVFGNLFSIEQFVENNSTFSSKFKYKEPTDSTARREGYLKLGTKNYGKSTLGMYLMVTDDANDVVLRVDDLTSMYFNEDMTEFVIENGDMSVRYDYSEEVKE